MDFVRRKIFAQHEVSSNSVGIYAVEYRDGKRWFGRLDNGKIIYDKGGYLADTFGEPFPLLYIPREMAPELTEQLSGLGYAKDAAAEIKGMLKATQSHLEDMRRLVFKNNSEGA
ncbi:MAG: hypothetical protein IPI97_14515 [Nitrosomonas sp.]|nr:hypothetical protein [Nitrosomonas sp.]